MVALIMSVAAWRLSREERARAAARIAALASAASSDAPAEPVIATAAVAAAPAPSVVDELPLRPVLRMVEPAPSAPVASFAPVAPPAPASYSEPGPDLVAPAGFLSGGEVPTQSAGRQRGLMAAAAVLFVVLGTGAYFLISGDSLTGDAGSVSATAASAPLELISLRHERQGTKLSLSGLVRNPSAGAVVEGLNAVVFLFDAQGGFISSARVGVDFKRLGAGDESPFVITMDAPSNVARYRVSFRTDAGVVAHVDRRSEQPVATAIVR
jgi:hypothetical protein